MSRGLALDDAAWASPWLDRSADDKLLLCLGLVVAGLVLPALPTLPVVLVACLGLAVGPAGVPPRSLLRAARGPLAFVALGSVPVAVDLDPAASWWFTTSPESLSQAATVGGRALAGTSALLLLAATTPVSELLARLARLGVPGAVVDVAAVMYRLLFVLRDSVYAVREAQAARLGGTGWRATVASSGSCAAAVLLRSWERARRLEEGLAGRGDGSLTVLAVPRRSSSRFRAVTVAGLALLLVIALAPGWAPSGEPGWTPGWLAGGGS